MSAGADLMRVTNILCRERARQGRTQNEVARSMGRAQTTLSRYENGSMLPDVEALFLWAAALGGRVVVEFPKEAA
ncbi:transcriptional regulator with XRE-family HTH domain [Azospirillum picis]|uniref:Transcriptional regulator with XRE-family HTH domain n=2 Tax=Azospirillum picis TaxID=488438 RepID=A0ABU0MQ86_9PROT|nr:transcriptional regulator with XRE-family HTH domain [Azospirillum picis]MDQ0535379.1 transcriptional regulator with XRE-family HTH domain [Azospirillum picis]